MENPYWNPGLKPHHLDRAEVRVACFDLINIFASSENLAGLIASAEADENPSDSSIFSLHHELAETQVSKLLLQVALFVRTFDDVMTNGDKSNLYAEHAKKTEGENFIGTLNGESLKLREACNKVIHAADFRPVYEFRPRDDDAEKGAWYMTGEVELGGVLGNKHWNATLIAQHFIEIALDRISFNLA
jgi:hypothetical protein